MSAIANRSGSVREDDLVGQIIGLVRERTGTDFALYRAATVERRIKNRMISVGTASLDAYLELLRATQSEAHQLLGRLTIKVSRFYRNAPTFDYLRTAVVPELARAGTPVRCWSIGCSRGEEPYTLAMLLADAGVDGLVHATDIDPEALEQAAAATYGPDALAELPCGLAAQYMESVAGYATPRYRVREAVRRRVVFSVHDITRDDALPGGGAFHIVTFRNVAIYLKRDVQELAFRRTVDALAAGGYLCLGEAEWPPFALEQRLDCAARKARIFRAEAIAGRSGA